MVDIKQIQPKSKNEKKNDKCNIYFKKKKDSLQQILDTHLLQNIYYYNYKFIININLIIIF